MTLVNEFTKEHSSFFAGVRNFFGRVFDTATKSCAAARRIEQVERLRALSDEELAARGIKRDDIVQHVFRDVFFI